MKIHANLIDETAVRRLYWFCSFLISPCHRIYHLNCTASSFPAACCGELQSCMDNLGRYQIKMRGILYTLQTRLVLLYDSNDFGAVFIFLSHAITF